MLVQENGALVWAHNSDAEAVNRLKDQPKHWKVDLAVCAVISWLAVLAAASATSTPIVSWPILFVFCGFMGLTIPITQAMRRRSRSKYINLSVDSGRMKSLPGSFEDDFLRLGKFVLNSGQLDYMLQNFPAYAEAFIVMRDRHDDSSSPTEQRKIIGEIEEMVAFYFRQVVPGSVDADTAARKARTWRYFGLEAEEQ